MRSLASMAAVTFCATFIGCASTKIETTGASTQRIQLVQLEAMFKDMRARAPWNVDGPLLWGYFFLGPNAKHLEVLAAELQGMGYRLVSLSGLPDQNLLRLHVERIEVHSPQSLHARNQEFYALAAKHSVASYDGMDVGPAPK